MNEKMKEELASKMVVENLRRYIPSIPDKITVRQACEYAMLMKAMDGEMAAYREAFKDDETSF
jgi:hypothetical protein